MSQTLRGRVVVKFPADVVAGAGITIDKSGATYTISATGGGGTGGVGEAPLDGLQYGRQNGTWTTIVGGGSTGATGTTGPYVLKAGDTMSGDLTISKVGPRLILNDTGTSSNFISGRKAGSPRWDLVLGNNVSQFVLANSTVGNVMVGGITNGTMDFFGGIQARSPPSNIAVQCMAAPGASLVDLAFVSSGGTAAWGAIEAKPAAIGLAHNSGGNVILHAGGVNVWEARAGTVVVAASDAYKPGGGLWLATSDIRVKTVLGPYDRGLAAVCALDPVRYVYKGNDKPDKDAETSQHAVAAQKRQEYVGLVAQDAEHAMPELVTKRRGLIDNEPVEDLRDLDSTPIIYALVNAVKELTARIAVLEGVARPKE